MCGLWRTRRNSSLCRRSTSRATSCSNRAKFRKPQKSTTTVLLAWKICRWRSVHSQLDTHTIVSRLEAFRTNSDNLRSNPTWFLGQFARSESGFDSEVSRFYSVIGALTVNRQVPEHQLGLGDWFVTAVNHSSPPTSLCSPQISLSHLVPAPSNWAYEDL